MNGLLGQRPAVNGLLDIPVTANRNMLAQALKARNKPEFQMKENTLQGILDGAAMATSPIPILGDLLGLGADANGFYNEPESRNWLNYGLAALGLLPFVPSGVKVYRAGGEFGRSADKGGPTFFSTKKEGAKPFANGYEISEKTINPNNVFDTQLMENKKIYEKFLEETGHPGRYGNTARPYWTVEHDLRQWLEKNNHKFDAIMFDEPSNIPSYAVYDKSIIK